MCALVARTGRHQQRYESGCRLVAGCIPFRYRSLSDDCDMSGKIVEVLMINSTSGPGLLFPKGGWENDETVEEAAVREAMEEAGVRGDLKDFIGHYDFKSKTHQDEFCPDGSCKAAVFALFVTEELEAWPEQDVRERTWLTILEAIKSCRYPWMRDALENGFLTWHGDNTPATEVKRTNNLGQDMDRGEAVRNDSVRKLLTRKAGMKIHLGSEDPQMSL